MVNIKKQIQTGAKWTAISTGLITLIQIIQFALLGNILTKEQFGVVGMITTVIVFTQIILDMGFGAAIIQEEHVSDEQLSTLYWINIMLGILLFFGLFFTSPFIADFYDQEQLSKLIQILGIMFLIAPIGQQFQYLLQKELNFRLLSRIEAFTNILAFVVLLLLLLIMNELVAYVISQVFLHSFKGILYYIYYSKKWKPSFTFHLSSIKKLASFGVFQLLSRLVNRLGANIDYILIGRFLGAEALGIYSLAYQVVTIPVLKINPIITRVAFPIFSKSNTNNSAMIEGFLHVSKILGIITFPMLIGLMAVSDLFIEIVFGERWLVATSILSTLAIVGLLRVLMNPNGSVILAKGKANIAFYWDLGVMLFYGVSLSVAVQFGVYQVALTYVVISLINFIFGRWLLQRLISLPLNSYLKVIWQPLWMASFMAILVYVLKKILLSFNPAEVSTLFVFLISIVTGFFIYGGFVFLKFPEIKKLKVFNKMQRKKEMF